MVPEAGSTGVLWAWGGAGVSDDAGDAAAKGDVMVRMVPETVALGCRVWKPSDGLDRAQYPAWKEGDQ